MNPHVTRRAMLKRLVYGAGGAAVANFGGLFNSQTIADEVRRSGKRCIVAMRHACQMRLRTAVYHWARVAVQHDARSRQRYGALRQRGHSHGRALRGVADRLLAVACSMLRTGTLYDPAKAGLAAA